MARVVGRDVSPLADPGYMPARCSPEFPRIWSVLSGAMWLVAGITVVSGLIAAVRMQETLPRSAP